MNTTQTTIDLLREENASLHTALQTAHELQMETHKARCKLARYCTELQERAQEQDARIQALEQSLKAAQNDAKQLRQSLDKRNPEYVRATASGIYDRRTAEMQVDGSVIMRDPVMGKAWAADGTLIGDGWIEWHGGAERPVDGMTFVDVKKYKDTLMLSHIRAVGVDWTGKLYYRLAK